MNVIITKNRYIDALLLLMLFSAVIHMAILFYLFFTTGNFYFINFFVIISASYFFPFLANNIYADITSLIFVMGMYGIILVLIRRS